MTYCTLYTCTVQYYLIMDEADTDLPDIRLVRKTGYRMSCLDTCRKYGFFSLTKNIFGNIKWLDFYPKKLLVLLI